MTKNDRQGKAEKVLSAVHVSLDIGSENPIEFEFTRPFTVGRDESCEIQIQNPGISRKHAEVVFQDGVWLLRDLESANGTYLDGKRVSEVPLESAVSVELGLRDATLTFRVEGNVEQRGLTVLEKPPSVTQYVERYFSNHTLHSAGEHTRMVREAFRVVDKRKKRHFAVIVIAILICTIAIAAYSYWQHRELERRTQLAEEIFYNMKSLELEISRLRARLTDQGDPDSLTDIQRQRQQLRDLTRNYERFLEEIEFYESRDWSESDLIILRVARILGECELGMPDEFRDKVYEYINEWKKSRRLEQSMRRAAAAGMGKTVVDAMLEYDLPPQFFFLALQESGFDEKAIGPATRFGIAKGIWQFIPTTAVRYGLEVGPLVELPRFDPRDQRHEAVRSTRAAAKYIRDIYNTEAQASGLLVIASYNWGENNVRSLVRSLPENPRERNFWKLLEQYGNRIPKETYNYVFYIVSAAVIGENPKLFGFNFENPFKGIDALQGSMGDLER